MKKTLLISALLLAGLFSAKSADTALFDRGTQPKFWAINPAAEFPGATGEMKSAPDQQIHFLLGFSGESRYLGIRYLRQLPAGATEIVWHVTSNHAFPGAFRILDANGRFFQTKRFPVTPGTAVPLTLKPQSAEWESVWGGTTETASPVEPYREIQLLVNRTDAPEIQIRQGEIRIAAPGINTKPFTGENFQFDAFGIQVAGTWQNGNAPILHLTVDAPEKLPAGTRLNLTFPDMFRDKVERFTLKPGKQTLVWPAPVELGGNPRNTYAIAVTLERESAILARSTTTLKGADSPDWTRTVKTADADASSIIGTGVHFNYALAPDGDFAGWYDYRTLLPLIADVGIKILRDDYWIYPETDGSHPRFPAFVERLKAAKALGFRTIAIIPLMADRSAENVCENLRAFVHATGDLVDVFELGNEPHNFGGWIQRFGGNWNAHDGNGKSSPWLLENLKVSNAAADCLRKLRPDAVIVGGGCVTSANHHFLKNGVSSALNGITDHPYSNMMPPERLAFGTAFNQRDGVVAGNDDLTLAGVIDAYRQRFKEIKREDLSLWFTEFGYTTYVYDGEHEKSKYGFAAYTEEAQAIYILRRFLQCMTEPTVRAVLQYDFLDDYNGAAFNPEANFGLLRADRSPKCAYFAVQRLTTLFNAAVLADQNRVHVEAQVLQRAAKRELLIDWEENGKTRMMADNTVHAALFTTGESLKLALWQGAAPNAEFAARVVTIRVRNAAEAAGRAVGIDMVSGKRFDVPAKRDGADLLLTVALGNAPVTVVL